MTKPLQFLGAMLSLAAVTVLAQRGGFLGGGEIFVPEGTRTSRELDSRST